jgi:hypothetical protein
MLKGNHHYNYNHHNVSTKQTGLMSNNKTIIALGIALGCFAILFPKIFYPMYHGSVSKSRSASDGKNFFNFDFINCLSNIFKY